MSLSNAAKFYFVRNKTRARAVHSGESRSCIARRLHGQDTLSFTHVCCNLLPVSTVCRHIALSFLVKDFCRESSGCIPWTPMLQPPSFPRLSLCFSLRVEPNHASRQIEADARSGSAFTYVMRRLSSFAKHLRSKGASRACTSNFDLAGEG
eukprot:scaffold1771_cov343-Pavlova_lutheri.AAC.26